MIVSPTAPALTNPLASTVATNGFVLDQKGAGPDGGIPGPKTTDTEKDSVSPIRSLALCDKMSIDKTCAISTGTRFITLAGDVGGSLQPTRTGGNTLMKIQSDADNFMYS
jgi:hypothetical protein